eukprot:TRINITY_DN6694_c0_g1_i3.p1 TRINITY_DN6694_c0_g1~~TRINITY_DN6694_c0_g1_i3.p1  ORF type:complete len:128 (-),score=53.50 TRINITY_DN6694_c0_g1_i3:60-443(-)
MLFLASCNFISSEHSVVFVFFFFKQKTAYEMLRSLVGSEMCIRDRAMTLEATGVVKDPEVELGMKELWVMWEQSGHQEAVEVVTRDLLLLNPCLLYTSDAADEEDSVDLGGRRIIKKKKREKKEEKS